MRPTATEPGLTKTENNMVCKRIQPLIAAKKERGIDDHDDDHQPSSIS